MPSRLESAEAVAATLTRAEQRRAAAVELVASLQLMERWAEVGAPVLVGAVAYGLVVAPDVDLEIYCGQPRVEAGFGVISQLAALPGVWKVRFSNELDGPDQGLYWQVRYRADSSEVWKVDMWLLAHNHRGPRAVDAVEPMRRALIDETRSAILEIKEALADRDDVRSVDVYRAVLDDGVRSLDAFIQWHDRNASTDLVDWLPRAAGGANG